VDWASRISDAIREPIEVRPLLASTAADRERESLTGHRLVARYRRRTVPLPVARRRTIEQMTPERSVAAVVRGDRPDRLARWRGLTG
jgi:hypothetical protein